MATPSQIEAIQRNAQVSTGSRTEEGKDRSRFHAVKHGMDASVPAPVVFQPVEPLAPTRLDAKSSTESAARAKFEISQNEPNFVNIDSTKALNGDHREDRGLDLKRGEGDQLSLWNSQSGSRGWSTTFWRSTATTRGEVDVEPFGGAFQPFGRSVWPATPKRVAQGGQLSLRLDGADLGPPSPASFRIGAAQLVPGGKGAQQGIVLAQAVTGVAGPGIIGKVDNHLGT